MSCLLNELQRYDILAVSPILICMEISILTYLKAFLRHKEHAQKPVLIFFNALKREKFVSSHTKKQQNEDARYPK